MTTLNSNASHIGHLTTLLEKARVAGDLELYVELQHQIGALQDVERSRARRLLSESRAEALDTLRAECNRLDWSVKLPL